MMEKSPIPFIEWAKSVQARLNFEYEHSRSILTHGTVIGAVREAVVRDILKKFLPPTTVIGTGQVIDSRGEKSNQVDIVISRGDIPVFQFDGDVSAFLHESVLATVEVKSMLYRDKIAEALDNSRSVKQLFLELEFGTSKGARIFDEAFDFIDSIGGVDNLDERLAKMDFRKGLGLSYDLIQVLHFVAYWLHWSKGDFANQAKTGGIFQQLDYMLFDDLAFFGDLLQFTQKQPDSVTAMRQGFDKAGEIKQEFFEKLYEYILAEHFPPVTLVLAYGGYETLENMVSEVRTWFDNHRAKVGWHELPHVIMNHKMYMHRIYNTYHCVYFDYPILWFAHVICEAMTRQLLIPMAAGLVSAPDIYFHLDKVLGAAHPSHSPDYMRWTIPLDDSSAGEIEKPNMITDHLNRTPIVRQQQRAYKAGKKKRARR